MMTVRTPHEALLHRIMAEFHEMPGLRVTRRQASRLFGVSEDHCAGALDELVLRKLLRRQANGMYVSAGSSLKRTA
jgi:hypothetical protein